MKAISTLERLFLPPIQNSQVEGATLIYEMGMAFFLFSFCLYSTFVVLLSLVRFMYRNRAFALQTALP